MSTLIETVVLYISNFVEIIQELSITAANYVFDVFGISPESISEISNWFENTKSTDQLGLSFTEFYKQSIGIPNFDQFQLLLVKIFLLILLSILIMIYTAWHIYGSAISDRFMYSEIVVENEQSDREKCQNFKIN